MAGAGAKKFAANSLLSSDDVNNYLADQVIMRFATSVARDAAFGGAGEPTLAEGMTCYLDDTNSVQSYNGTSWVTILSTDRPPALEFIKTQTATSGTAIDLTSVFSSTYDNYRVIISSYRAGSGAGLTLQLGTGSATATGYYWGGIYLSAYTAVPTVAAHGGSNVSNFETAIIADASNDGGGNIDIYSPNLARNTMIVAQPVDGRVASGTPRLPYSGYQSATTQFTSLHLNCSAGYSNIVVKVYGYRNS